jgi:hypothetical protein
MRSRLARSRLASVIVPFFGIALALQLAAAPAIAQSIAFDNRPRPGSPTTGWSGNFSPSDPYSEGPGNGAPQRLT